jgi:hypothetical protein
MIMAGPLKMYRGGLEGQPGDGVVFVIFLEVVHDILGPMLSSLAIGHSLGEIKGESF